MKKIGSAFGLIALLLVGQAQAQGQSITIPPGVQSTGSIAANDCAKFTNPLLITSTGAACAGATAPGGSTTQLQYNNVSAFGGISGWTTNGTTALTGGASTTIAIGGATPGSNALAVTGTGAFSSTFIVGTTSSGIELGATSNRNLTFYNAAGPNISARIMGDQTGSGGQAKLQFASGGSIEWNSTASLTGGTIDLTIYRDAANTLAQRNGVNAQTLRVYNTFTDASNYERVAADWATTANTLTLGAQAAGTGTLRAVNIVGAGVGIGVSGLTLTAGALAFPKITASASAPGAAGSKFEVVCGTNAGTAKMVMYAGTSGTAVTVIDNAGTGVTGC